MNEMNFKQQIDEDIQDYQVNYSHIPNINKNEWAFNFWVLDKLFNEDEEIIESKIIDYRDMGVDCYEINEETEDIYLIQNKYYSENTKLSVDYVKNDFLLRPIGALENGTYTKSKELQTAFNRLRTQPDFCLHLHLYVTNNSKSEEIEKYIHQFNSKHQNYNAKIFYLEDIKDKYYGEIFQEKKHFNVTLNTINNGTVLKILPDQYNLNLRISANYVLAPVVSVYKMYKEAKKIGYPIFDMNIREYLGQTGVNKKIYNTLFDEKERNNFFYYNNGITIICDSISKINMDINTNSKAQAQIEIENPQVVNGCQTVNSIYEALENKDSSTLEQEFEDTFVMIKVLEIDKNNATENELYNNIVKYTNSQNSINEKNFVANSNVFLRIQKDFEDKGFLLLIKQSDKKTFEDKYSTISDLSKLNTLRLERFNLPIISKVSDCFIQLDKLLQVFLAFVRGGQEAYVKKSRILHVNTEQYNAATEFCKNVTTENLLDLYLLYKKAEIEKKESKDNRTPIPFYLIDAFSKYECKNDASKISVELSDSTKVNKIVKLYKIVSSMYAREYIEENSSDYNTMIKSKIDYQLLDKTRLTGLDIIETV